MRQTSAEDRVTVYFGKPGSDIPTKSEVEEFVRKEMCLVQGPNEIPQWSIAIGQLVRLGMEAYEAEMETLSYEEMQKISELEGTISSLRKENQRLREEIEKYREEKHGDDPVDRVHSTEARVLEVLDDNPSSGRHTGTRGMNYVELVEISRETGLGLNEVLDTCNALARAEYGEYVKLDSKLKKAKATSRDAFEEYCASVDLNPELIKKLNGRQ